MDSASYVKLHVLNRVLKFYLTIFINSERKKLKLKYINLKIYMRLKRSKMNQRRETKKNTKNR